MIKNFNVVTKRSYKASDGTEKTIWMNVGRLTQFPATSDKPEGFRLELGMFPTTDFMVFPQEKKTDSAAPAPAEDINPDDIPF